MIEMTADTIRVGEAAARLGLTTRDVLRLIDHGRLPVRRNERGLLVLSPSEVERVGLELGSSPSAEG